MILTFFDNHLVSRVQNWAENKLQMLLVSYTNISPSFILILSSIQEKQWKTFF